MNPDEFKKRTKAFALRIIRFLSYHYSGNQSLPVPRSLKGIGNSVYSSPSGMGIHHEP